MPRTHVMDTPFPSTLPTLRPGAELDVESLREPGEQLFAGLLFAFNVVVFIGLAVAIVLAPIPMAVMLLYAGGFAFAVWVSTKLICTDCGAANPFDSRFCEQCGAAVAVSLSA